MNLTQRGAERNYCNRILIWAILAMLFMFSLAAPTPTLADSLTIGPGCPGANVSSGTATVICTDYQNANVTASYSAFGTLNGPLTGSTPPGVFGVEASVVQLQCIVSAGNGCGASTGVYLNVTYLFGGLGVSSGMAQFDLTVNGTISGPRNAQSAEFEVNPGETLIVNGTPLVASVTAQLPSGKTSLTVETPITNGSGTLNFSLVAGAACYGSDICTSQSNFLDPLTITGASAFDANGNPVSATFVSESGFNPNAGGAVAAPEPSSLSLLCFGILGLVALSLKKAVA